MFDFKPTKKGLLQAEFVDRFGAICSIQESSFPDEPCIWLGVEVDIQAREISTGRMHLSRDLANRLLPVLRHFVRTGEVGVDVASEEFKLGMWVVGVGSDNQDVQGRIIHTDASGFVVQAHDQPGPEGQTATVWDAAHLFWEVTETPANVLNRYDLIAADDADDDSV